MDTIRQTDAILAHGDTANPSETDWPDAEFIIGNPPFLGHAPFREQLGDEYVNAVYSLYGSRIPNSSDLCCYWFEKARAQIEAGKSRRAGLLATQAIRFQSNRPVLARIKGNRRHLHRHIRPELGAWTAQRFILLSYASTTAAIPPAPSTTRPLPTSMRT